MRSLYCKIHVVHNFLKLISPIFYVGTNYDLKFCCYNRRHAILIKKLFLFVKLNTMYVNFMHNFIDTNLLFFNLNVIFDLLIAVLVIL